MDNSHELPSSRPAPRRTFDRLFWLELRDDTITIVFALILAALAAASAAGVAYFGFIHGDGPRTTACVFFAGITGTFSVKLFCRVIRRIKNRFANLSRS
ncbi:hypothetical protein [Streptomyces sp. NRRL B-3648]|uniref:hypothetical protein n=1 Tax=Streptomyces sp. NRRL B-3648 TaxID=1519493 RepID=UPI000B03CC9A|nr:hypothetical protein [Streptomyces sp. NRRL B-3648]